VTDQNRVAERDGSDECICGEINARHCPVHADADRNRAAVRDGTLLQRLRGWADSSEDADDLTPEDFAAVVTLVEAAQLIRAYDQAGGNEWWEAHAKLYAALVPFVGERS
jgi:hypothetical protein